MQAPVCLAFIVWKMHVETGNSVGAGWASELNEQQDQQLSPSWWLQELRREALSLLAVIPPGVHLFFPKVHQRDSQGITELQKEAICLNSWESGEQKKKPGFLALLQNFAVIQWCRTIEIGDC